MIVIRNKETGKYMGGLNRKTGNHVSCDDCVKAKKYSTKNRAIAALVAMGYSDHSKLQFLEVESKNSIYPKATHEKIVRLDNNWRELRFAIDAEYREVPVDRNKIDRLRSEQEVINVEMKKLFDGEDV